MNPSSHRVAAALRLLVPWAAAGVLSWAHAAPQLTAAAGSIGGAGNGDIAGGCTTYGPSPLFLNFFGSGQGIPLPAGGIGACGYSGLQVVNTAGSGSADANTSVGPVILGNPGYAGYYTGSAGAEAQFTGLHSASQGSYSSGLPGSPTALSDSSSAAFLSDALTVTSSQVAPASAGFVGYRFQIDGSVSATGAPAPYYAGEVLADLALQHADGPVYGAAHIYTRRGELGSATSGGRAMPGWTGSIGQVSGGSMISTLDYLSAFPIVFGQSWDFQLGLPTHAIGESSASFMSTARLVRIGVFDAQGQRITDFTLSAASGTDYISAVPEPTHAALLLLGLAGLVTTRFGSHVRLEGPPSGRRFNSGPACGGKPPARRA